MTVPAGTESPGLLRSTFARAVAALRSSYMPLLGGVLVVIATQIPSQAMNWSAGDVHARQIARAQQQQEQFGQQMKMMEQILGSFSQGTVPTPPPAPPPPPTQQEFSEMMADSAILMGLGCAGFLLLVFLQLPALSSAFMLGATIAARRSPRSNYFCGFRRYWQTFLAWMIALVAYFVLSFPVGCIGGLGFLVQSFRAGRMLDVWDWDVLWIYALATFVFSPFYVWVLTRWGWALVRVADPVRTSAGPWNCYVRSWRATRGSMKWRVAGTLLAVWAAALAMLLPAIAVIYFGTQTQDESVQIVGYIMAGLIAVFAAVPWTLAAYGAMYETIMSCANDVPTPPAQAELAAAP